LHLPLIQSSSDSIRSLSLLLKQVT
jgi:hypothetical protein